jgi:Methyltransferase domain
LNCRICSTPCEAAFDTLVLTKHHTTFDYCQACGFLGARNAFWLDEAYDQVIALTDTGLVARNVSIARRLSSVLLWLSSQPQQDKFIDVAGGYGLLTRLMRDNGFDFYWSDKYCKNFFAEGFEEAAEAATYFAATAFEVMEHLEQPNTFVSNVFQEKQIQHLIFSTQLFDGPPPPPEKWWYYSFDTGQHIAFFQRRTLQYMAAKLGLHFASSGDLHMFSMRPVNELLLRLVSGRASYLLAVLARKNMGTKTMQDHEKMVAKLQAARLSRP